MYNEEVKQAFLDSLKERGVGKSYMWDFKTLFNRTEQYEEKFNLDLSRFSEDQLKFVFKQWGGIKVTTALAFLNKVKYYTVRQIEGEDTSADHITLEWLEEELGVDGDLYDKPKPEYKGNKGKIISYHQLQQALAKMTNPLEQFLIYGLFCGIKGIDYCELCFSTMKGSNPKSGLIWLASVEGNDKINLKGRKFYADRQLFNYASEATKMTEYYSIDKNGVKNRLQLQKDTDAIFKRKAGYKPLSDPKNARSSIDSRLKIILKQYDELKDFDCRDLYWSGFIYAVRKQAIIEGKERLTELKELEGIDSIISQYNTSKDLHNIKRSLKRYL